jgi:hypothetical protein
MRKSSFIITITPAILAALFVAGCSRSQIPPNAHVQDLGVLKLQAGTRTPMPLAGDVSLYCVASRPEQLPQKVEFFATVTNASNNTQRLDVDVVPTPVDYQRLGLKHLSVPFHPGERYEFKVSENEWVRFIPRLETQ